MKGNEGIFNRVMTDNAFRSAARGHLALSVQRNPPSVRIDDESKLPSDYLETITTIRARKKEILDALKTGQVIPGAQISQSMRLVIR